MASLAEHAPWPSALLILGLESVGSHPMRMADGRPHRWC